MRFMCSNRKRYKKYKPMIEARFGNAYFWDSFALAAWFMGLVFFIISHIIPALDVIIIATVIIAVSAWRLLSNWNGGRSTHAAFVMALTYTASCIGFVLTGSMHRYENPYVGAVLPCILFSALWTALPDSAHKRLCCRGWRRPQRIRAAGYKPVRANASLE
jgi:hypothetical protein